MSLCGRVRVACSIRWSGDGSACTAELRLVCIRGESWGGWEREPTTKRLPRRGEEIRGLCFVCTRERKVASGDLQE